MPILRRIFGTPRRGNRARSAPSRITWPRVATSSRMISRIRVDLPAPDGPTMNTKSPSGMTRSTSRRATFPLGNSIVTSCMTRTAGSWSGGASGRLDEALSEGAHRRRCGGHGHIRLRGRRGRPLRDGRGAGVLRPRGARGSHVGPEATTPWRSPPCAATPYRSPGEIGRYLSKSVGGRSQHRSSGNGSRRRPDRSAGTSARSAAPGIHEMKAPRGSTAVEEVAEHRIEQRLVPDEHRANPSAGTAVAVSECVAVRAEVQPSVAILLAQVAVVVRMLEAEQLAVERVDRSCEPAMAVAVRARDDLLERNGGNAAGERGERLRSLDVADQAEQRRPGHDPVERIEGVRDRLCAVRRGGARHPVPLGRQHAAQQVAPQPLGLHIGEHEQHRQEPHALTDGGDREADDPFAGRGIGVVLGGDHESLRVRGTQVAVVALDDREVVRDLRLVESQDVVVDRDPPDFGADRDVVVGRRPEADRRAVRAPPGRSGHAASSPLRVSPPASPPVASRSSSACMNVSRSPSRTAPVLPVS